MITIARIDERLIHGQVAYAWTVAYKSEAIMVIDNEIAKDKFQISLLQMACPAGVKCFICDEDKAVELLKKYEKRKIFVVVKHPGTLLSICKGWKRSTWAACISRREGVKSPKPFMWTRRWRRCFGSLTAWACGWRTGPLPRTRKRI